jgi:transcriptional regulator with XRE-family HTH domain
MECQNGIFQNQAYILYMSIGDNIAKFRQGRGLTQAELGEKLGVSQNVIARYENNLRNPPLEKLPILAKALGVTLEELFGLKEKELKATFKRNHGNRRSAKILDIFEKLNPGDQRAVVNHMKGLLATK